MQNKSQVAKIWQLPGDLYEKTDLLPELQEQPVHQKYLDHEPMQ